MRTRLVPRVQVEVEALDRVRRLVAELNSALEVLSRSEREDVEAPTVDRSTVALAVPPPVRRATREVSMKRENALLDLLDRIKVVLDRSPKPLGVVAVALALNLDPDNRGEIKTVSQALALGIARGALVGAGKTRARVYALAPEGGK